MIRPESSSLQLPAATRGQQLFQPAAVLEWSARRRARTWRVGVPKGPSQVGVLVILSERRLTLLPLAPAAEQRFGKKAG